MELPSIDPIEPAPSPTGSTGSGSGSLMNNLRKEFENSAIRKRDWKTATPLQYKSDVRSVFGWTDATEIHDTEDDVQLISHAMGEHQATLPRLPVPDLDHTGKMFLRSLEPLLSADDFDQAEAEMTSFIANEGPILQEKLKQRSQDTEGVSSWLEEWWDDSYLCSRDSIAINVNYFFGFEDDPDPEKMHQIGRAASLLHGAMTFFHRYDSETLDMDFERSKPLCMSQMRRVFSASRIPSISRDHIVTYLGQKKLSKVEQISNTSSYSDAQAKHIMVLSGSKFFSIRVFSDDGEGGERLLTVPELEVLLNQVVEVSKQIGSGIPVETATALNRDQWARLRERLIIHSERNRETLDAIQQALAVCVLETMSPNHDEELSRLLLHGAGVNRWFDRHNLIVCANGRAGINFEHSVGDGATTLRVADQIYTHSVTHGRKADVVEAEMANTSILKDVSMPIPRGWVLNKQIEAELREAHAQFKEKILSTESDVLQFRQYGGLFVKQVAGMSPDAFVQVAMQLAYYRYYGRCDATYEAASTRSFFHGRTEVVRSATPEVAHFCKTVDNTSLSHRVAGQKLPTQLRLLREAVLAHVGLMKEAKQAQGVDRHLLGLRMIFEDERDTFKFDLPALFRGKGYHKSSHWNLSTSHCGSPSLSMFGFGPVVNDGFGVGYMIRQGSISFNITAHFNERTTSCKVFASLLEESLLHMRAIVLTDPERIAANSSKSLEFNHPTSHTDDMLAEWLRTGSRTASFRPSSRK
eukprot:TRINITY_DN6998_c2_g1_i2.p1 TRINITY_DN6998_c2_g1~~TRINITY_DN6998_c2_g1_i2.p1  ORF type:complete len:776 (+),score=314.30 TRINITY_DN6998_c2_g1_i2:70-2328(+)